MEGKKVLEMRAWKANFIDDLNLHFWASCGLLSLDEGSSNVEFELLDFVRIFREILYNFYVKKIKKILRLVDPSIHPSSNSYANPAYADFPYFLQRIAISTFTP